MAFCKKLFILIFFLLLAMPSSYAQNSADGIVFDAEDATITGYGQKNQTIHLKKRVQIIFEGQYLGCDEASIDTRKTLIVCKGNVRLVGPDAKLEAEQVELNYKHNSGVIRKGFVQVGQVLFEGDEIRKISATEYQTVRGNYTACTTCPPFWSFSGSKVDAEIGGYAYIKNALIYFGRIPTLWFPYLIVPLKSERQTGLLFPSYQYSNSSGFTVSESFFWAMSESHDSTWTAKYYTNRGTKGLLNYRYMSSAESHGEFDFGFLRDRLFSKSDEVAPHHPNGGDIDRWFLKYKHQYALPYGFIHRMNLNTVSDTLYPRDFSKEIEGRGDPSLENRVSLTKNTDYSHWSLDTSYYRSLLNENPLESNYLSVHRFPEMNYSIVPMRIMDSSFLFNVDINYVNFARDNISYDNLDGSGNYTAPDGTFDSTQDKIRTGQRLDIEPAITRPITIGEAFNLTPTISFRETHYQFSIAKDPLAVQPYEPSTYRRYFRSSVSLNTHFSKVFGPDDSVSDRYKHVIEPDITYTAIPWSEQHDHPFFSGDAFDSNFKKDQPVSDGDNIQFDYRDRVYEKNLVTYSLSNKIWRKRWYQGTPQYVQIIRHKLSQSYDIHEENRDTSLKRQPWSEISSLLDIRYDFFETNSLVKFYPYQKGIAHSTRVKFFDQKKNFLELTYSQDFLITDGAVIDLNSRTRDLKTGIGFNLRYLDFIGETTYNIIKSDFQSYKMNIVFRPPGDCWAIHFSQERKTDSETEYNLNVSFLFNGKSDTNSGGS
jgi:LPS-assembly protein